LAQPHVHPRSKSTQPGIWSGFLLGFAFAFGWTPCIGHPATVLTFAAASDLPRAASSCLLISAGLAFPFADRLGTAVHGFHKNFRNIFTPSRYSAALALPVGGPSRQQTTWLSAKYRLNRFSPRSKLN
jgi:cytochrome c biogenesis protein CcdA